MLFWAVSEALRFKRKSLCRANPTKSPLKRAGLRLDGSSLDKAIVAEAWDYESKSLSIDIKAGHRGMHLSPRIWWSADRWISGFPDLPVLAKTMRPSLVERPFCRKSSVEGGGKAPDTDSSSTSVCMGEHTHLHTTYQYKEQKKEKKNCDFCPLWCVVNTFQESVWLKSWSSFD